MDERTHRVDSSYTYAYVQGILSGSIRPIEICLPGPFTHIGITTNGAGGWSPSSPSAHNSCSMSKYRGVGRTDIFNGLHFCSWHFVARRGRAERQVIAVNTQPNPQSPNTALEDKPMDTNGSTVMCLDPSPRKCRQHPTLDQYRVQILRTHGYKRHCNTPGLMTASAVRRRVLPVLS